MSIFHVFIFIATNPKITRPTVKKNQSMIPVKGLYFEPTISEVITKNMTTVPGPSKPIKNRETANTQ